jgi:hypothetical protein
MAMTRLQLPFLALVVVQAAHSVEEYVGRLYEVFPPARFLTGLISSDRQNGFVILNVLLVAFGLWCFFWPVRKQWASAAGFIWIWIAIEFVNGIGHPLWSIVNAGYTPGVATAPVLLVLALYLARLRLRPSRGSASLARIS